MDTVTPIVENKRRTICKYFLAKAERDDAAKIHETADDGLLVLL